MKLERSYYLGDDVTEIARGLLGKSICTRLKGIITKGKIVETEAYSEKEKACHAYGRRKTERTSVMFGEGGHAYVYFVYGMHYLFNIVTNRGDVAEAILIRAIEPIEGVDVMLKRRGMSSIENRLTSGPGSLSKAMGIDLSMYGLPLDGDIIWLEQSDKGPEKAEIISTKRIGVDYAGEDAGLPWRFILKDNPWISKK